MTVDRPDGGSSRLLARIWTEVWEDELPDRAAALSYYLLFALFPALLFLTALLGVLPWRLMDLLMTLLGRVLPSDVVERTFVEITGGAGGGLLTAGIAVAFWSAVSGMLSVMSALNAVYDVVERRPWWHQRLVAIGLTLGVTAFILTGLVVVFFGELLGRAAAQWLGLEGRFEVGWLIARWALSTLLLMLGVGLVYHWAPAARPRWRWPTPGAVFAVGVWIVMSIGLKFYVSRFGSYTVTYGSIAGVVLLLLWLYLSALTLLVGAQLDSELDAVEPGASRRRGWPAKAAAP